MSNKQKLMEMQQLVGHLQKQQEAGHLFRTVHVWQDQHDSRSAQKYSNFPIIMPGKSQDATKPR